MASCGPEAPCQVCGSQSLIREVGSKGEPRRSNGNPFCGVSPNLKYSPYHLVTGWVTLDGHLAKSHSIGVKLVFLVVGPVLAAYWIGKGFEGD